MVDVESMCLSTHGLEQGRATRSGSSQNDQHFPTADEPFEIAQNLDFSLPPACNFIEKTDDLEKHVGKSSGPSVTGVSADRMTGSTDPTYF